MILRLFRRRSRSIEGRLEKSSNNRSGKDLADTINASSNIGKNTVENNATFTSKTIVLAELAKILANPSQLLELVRKSPILYMGYVRNDSELRNIIKRCGNTPLLLSIRSSSSAIHVVYLDGKFYTLTDGKIRVVNRIVSDNDNVRVIIYRLE